MLLQGQSAISIRFDPNRHDYIEILDQRYLPDQIIWETLKSSESVAKAIKDMHLRGAPLIGAAAAFGACFALKESLPATNFQDTLQAKLSALRQTRPTAVNLNWAIDAINQVILQAPKDAGLVSKCWQKAAQIVADDINQCKKIGEFGLEVIADLWHSKRRPINILTHCNAGWLACLDWGTATSPIYHAQIQDIPIHVWVDETRPRNQGARLTAFELEQQQIPYTVICDNTGGHLMQHGLVDVVFVGSDRTTMKGDVANKIGTYLKALAANDNEVPFYVALPSSTFDIKVKDGVKEIPIEEREPTEVTLVEGFRNNQLDAVRITPAQARAINYGFDVTPARLVTGLVTERGIINANEDAIMNAFPEFAQP